MKKGGREGREAAWNGRRETGWEGGREAGWEGGREEGREGRRGRGAGEGGHLVAEWALPARGRTHL